MSNIGSRTPYSNNYEAKLNYILQLEFIREYGQNVTVVPVPKSETKEDGCWNGPYEFEVYIVSKDLPSGNFTTLPVIKDLYEKIKKEHQPADHKTISGVNTYETKLSQAAGTISEKVNNATSNLGKQAGDRLFYLVLNENPEHETTTSTPYVINDKPLAEMPQQTIEQPVPPPSASVPAEAAPVELKPATDSKEETSSEKADEMPKPVEELTVEQELTKNTLQTSVVHKNTSKTPGTSLETLVPAEVEQEIEDFKGQPVLPSTPVVGRVASLSADPAANEKKEESKATSPTQLVPSSPTKSSSKETEKTLHEPDQSKVEEPKQNSPVKEKKVKIEEPKTSSPKTVNNPPKKVETPSSQPNFVWRIFSGFGRAVSFVWSYTGGALIRFVRSFF